MSSQYAQFKVTRLVF